MLENLKILSGVNPAFLGYLLSKDYSYLLESKTVLILFPEVEGARDFLTVFQALSEKRALLYPAPDLPPFSEAITYNEDELERIKVLWELPHLKVIVCTPQSFIRRGLSRDVLSKHYIYLIPGERIEREAFTENLINLGYERVGIVRSKGEFTVKGAVIDLFSPQYDAPVRIEFFGSEILSLKSFNPETQRTLATLEELVILPSRELFFPKDLGPIYSRIEEYKGKISENRFNEILQIIENKAIQENPDFLLPLVHGELKLLIDNIPLEKIFLIIFEREKVFQVIEAFWERIYRMSQRARLKEKLFYNEERLFAPLEEIRQLLERVPSLEVKELPFSGLGIKSFELAKLELDPTKPRLEQAFFSLKNFLEEGKEVLLFSQDIRNQRAILEGLKFRETSQLEKLQFLRGELKEGFIWEKGNLVLTSDFELFGKRSIKVEERKEASRVRGYFRRFEDLKPGDFVVHKIHGIGRFQGLVSLRIDGFEGEFIEIEYDGGDKLYLPVIRLNEIYPYVGLEDKPPSLDKLGKKTFLKRRKEVERSLNEVVEEILRLYAERRAIKSFALPFNSLAYAEFAQTFPFEETPDQISAIEEVLQDLTSPKPMERLLVGDVGFGKTEVALRAIFVTAIAGKQVAVLTPTTLLAEQHYRNFKQRLEPFGIKVGVLSRLRNPREQREVLEGIREGKIHVVIGTHRLLSKDVNFKDLALLVIDEEHRFGVKQKEKLKQLKKSVKVLSLSATPIPRSLQLSLLGIFDLSILETPPPGRKTIKTILTTFEPEIIKNAIEEELLRGGQVYFVHPRIQGLGALAKFLQKLCPKARIDFIHGQMDEELLERTLYKFLNKELDVLVCTPIIGSGIDIPSANTIFINRADLFGLADIYQLRGRVGRSQEKAYCYLLVPDLRTITEGAQRRLKALMQFVELGSGFKLSMSDLKIRGAGALLGVDQSGHINKVGYELYLELLENTIRQLRGEEIEEWEPEVNFRISAFFSSSYIPETEERLSLYRELVLIKDLESLANFEEFLRDKYGPLPPEAKNLLSIYELKLLMKKLKIPFMEERGNQLKVMLQDLTKIAPLRKIAQNSEFKISKVQVEKDKAWVYFQIRGSHLESALKFCHELLAK